MHEMRASWTVEVGPRCHSLRKSQMRLWPARTQTEESTSRSCWSVCNAGFQQGAIRSAHGIAWFVTEFARRRRCGDILLPLLALQNRRCTKNANAHRSYSTTTTAAYSNRPNNVLLAERTRSWTSYRDAISISIRDCRRRPSGIALHMHWCGSVCVAAETWK